MAIAPMIQGLDALFRKMDQIPPALRAYGERGLVQASRYLQQDMEETPPLTPMDTGNLIKSFFIISKSRGVEEGANPGFIVEEDSPSAVKKLMTLETTHASVLSAATTDVKASHNISVRIGYTAFYAAYVHENMEAMNWTRPKSGPKWFSAALRRNRSKMFSIVGGYVRIKFRRKMAETAAGAEYWSFGGGGMGEEEEI